MNVRCRAINRASLSVMDNATNAVSTSTLEYLGWHGDTHGAPQPPDVVLELRALEDVSIHTTALTRPAADAGVETTCTELLLNERVELSRPLPLHELLLHALALLLRIDLLCGTLTGSTTLGSHRLAVVSLVRLTERSGIDLNDSILDKGVGADQLVVRGVEDDTKDTGLGGDVLRSPSKIAAVGVRERQ